MSVVEELYTLIRQNPGNRPLQLSITAKLQNVIIESALKVDNKIITALEGNVDVDIL